MNSRTWFAAAACAALAVATACSDSTSPSTTSGFGSVQPLLTANDCRSCHNTINTAFHGNFNLAGTRAADSAAVDGYLDFVTPAQSALVLRLMRGSPLRHSLKLWDSATDSGAAELVAYAGQLALAGLSHELVAQRVTAAPQVDGVAEAAWAAVPALAVAAQGGFAGDITVTMRAM